jgi:ribonuclease R
MARPKKPKPARVPQGLPDRDTLLKFIRESGETDKAAIARAFGL